VELDIWGEGPDRDALAEEISRKGLDKVQLRGGSTNVAALLPQYDLFLSTSIYEGFGIAPLEAMAAGLPVACSNLRTFEEVMADVPLYFSLNDPLNLVQLFERIIADPSMIAQLGERGRNKAELLASESAYLDRLMKLYLSVG